MWCLLVTWPPIPVVFSFLTLSREVVQFCTTRCIFNFTHRKYFSRASTICEFWLHDIGHDMAKCEGSSFITSKVTAFFWKVPTTIFVNPGQFPCKLVRTENDITFSKTNIFQQNLERKCILILAIDWYKQKLKIRKITRFFPIVPEKMTFWKIWDQNFRSGHIVWYLCYIMLQSNTF